MPITYLSESSQSGTVPALQADEERPVYICVSGLTGAGKSTVLSQIAELVGERRTNVVVLDEKVLHHPYLDRLFVDPDEFAFELQLQFMVNRAIFVKRWLSAGYSLVMERSHLEDPVFIRNLRAFGYVTTLEQATYLAVWTRLAERLPVPDLVAFLDVPAEVSIERLQGDSSGGRPAFADYGSQRAWVASWHDLYKTRFDELNSDSSIARRIVTFTNYVDPVELNQAVAAVFARTSNS